MDRKRQRLTPEKVIAELEQVKEELGRSELESEIDKYKEQCTELQSENEKLQSENEKFQSENEKLQSENEKLQSENEKLQSENEKLQRENKRLQKYLQDLESASVNVGEKRPICHSDVTGQITKIMASNDEVLNIDSLPEEMLISIFSHLPQNELRRIARVCRRWNLLTKSPLLWKKVNVKFSPSHKYQYTVAESFINRLPSCVSSIRLDFTENDYMENDGWIGTLRFVELCVKLQQKCPHLEKLMLANSELYEILPSVIDLCTQFLHDVKNLVFHKCVFSGHPVREEFVCTSKIEVLDLTYCWFDVNLMPQFSKMPCLKELCLRGTYIDDSWFKDDSSFLNQLYVLNVGNTEITAISFPSIQNHGHNLKELYLCNVKLRDHDFNFNNSIFPHLKTICLSVPYVTCEGVVSLIQSCPSLENVYVDEDVAESFAAHPFVLANRCKSGIVKAIKLIHKHNNY